MPNSSHATSRNKKKFTLPVTPFVKKILIARYGHPVNVNQFYHREICTLLQLNPIINVDRKKKMLTTELEFLTQYNLAKAVLQTDLDALGVSMHSHYLYKMYEFIYMHIEIANTMSAYKALQLFFDKYGITDEDFDFESAYRGWVRYKKNQTPTFRASDISPIKESVSTKFFFNVHKKLTQLEALSEGKTIGSAQLNKVMRTINIKQFPLTTIHKVYYFFLKNICNLSYQQIADRVGKSKGAIRYHIRTAKSYIQKTESAALFFQKIIEGLKIHIIPVLLKSAG